MPIMDRRKDKDYTLLIYILINITYNINDLNLRVFYNKNKDNYDKSI